MIRAACFERTRVTQTHTISYNLRYRSRAAALSRECVINQRLCVVCAHSAAESREGENLTDRRCGVRTCAAQAVRVVRHGRQCFSFSVQVPGPNSPLLRFTPPLSIALYTRTDVIGRCSRMFRH